MYYLQSQTQDMKSYYSLPTSEGGSLKRLESFVRKLQRNLEQFKKYDITQEQLSDGVIERVEEPQRNAYYIHHKPVIKTNAETTKMRIVFDASAKEREGKGTPSLNDCLETGPSLQNPLWNVMVRNRFKRIALSADLKKAFVQVLIRADDRCITFPLV